ncbi:uncharacterized protein [Diabrotica undecimpunctata]|uniref:uncharacterized protein n=1 Tax=Diabrotica undecimpunctata TaxID=50387 RepID=UPI003B640135
MMLTGPQEQPDLFDILCRFRIPQFVCYQAIKELTSTNIQKYPLACEAFLTQTYVDDILCGAETEADLENTYHELNTVLGLHFNSQMGFQFNKVHRKILAETWRITENNRRKLVAVEMNAFRRSVGVSRRERIRNDEIRQRMGVDGSLTTDIERKQLIWYGHVQRIDNSRLKTQDKNNYALDTTKPPKERKTQEILD